MHYGLSLASHICREHTRKGTTIHHLIFFSAANLTAQVGEEVVGYGLVKSAKFLPDGRAHLPEE